MLPGVRPTGTLPSGAAIAAVVPMAACPSERALFLSSREFDRASVSASTESSYLPATFLQDPDPSRRWRTTSKLDQYLNITLARPVSCNALAIGAHLLSGAGILRVSGAASLAAMGTPTVDTGWVSAWPLGAKPIDEDWPSYMSLVRWSNDAALPCWKVEFADVGASPGYIEVGRLWIGRSFQPLFNVDQNPTLGLDPPDAQIKSDYGKTFIDPRGDAPRRMVLPISNVNHRDMMDSLFELQRYAGMGRDLAFFLDPAATTDFHKYSMQCVFAGGASFDGQPMFDNVGQVWRSSLTLTELL